MNCPATGLPCPRTPCPGAGDPGVCNHWAALTSWRSVPTADQIAHFRAGTGTTPGPADPATTTAILDRPAGLIAELVVARYAEDARWAEELA